jgi:hypothetical protein
MNAADLPPPNFTPPPPNLPPPAPVETPIELPRIEKQTEPLPSATPAPMVGSAMAATDEEVEALESERLVKMLLQAFKYPLSKDGWAILIPGGVMAILLSIGSLAPVIGLVAVIFSAGYFASYYSDIISSSINGDENPPDWPVISNFMEDIVGPAFMMMGVALISFSPTLLYSAYAGELAADGIIGSLLYFAGCAYFPMAMISFVMNSSVAAALPHRVIPAILRCLPEYFVPVVLLIGIKILSVLLDGVFSILPVQLSSPIMTLVWFYLLMVQARITGLTGLNLRERIGWG